MAQVTPLAAVEAMQARVDSIASARHISGACQPEMYKLPMRQSAVSTRLPPKAPDPAAPNTPTNTGIAHHKQWLTASFTQLKPGAVRRPGTAPAAGALDIRAHSTAAYAGSDAQGLQGQHVVTGDSVPWPGDATSNLLRSRQLDLSTRLPAAVNTHDYNRKLSACRSARSSQLQQYLQTPSCTPASRVSVMHGVSHRPVDRPTAPADKEQQPLAVSAFWDSSEARAPITDANGAVGVDLLTYMRSTSYAASAASTGDSGNCCRPSTVPNMRSSGRRQSTQEGGKARPSTSSAAQHPLEACIGPWDTPPGELHQLQHIQHSRPCLLIVLRDH